MFSPFFTQLPFTKGIVSGFCAAGSRCARARAAGGRRFDVAGAVRRSRARCEAAGSV